MKFLGFVFFSQSREMHVKNRTIVNRANLVKVYWGHMPLQSRGFF